MKTFFPILVLFGLFGFVLPAVSINEEHAHLSGDGVISLYNLHLEEKEVVRFRDSEGHSIPDGMERINHLLRCRGTQKETTMALPLLDVVDHLQDKFGADEVQIISGYRAPEFNDRLKKAGRKVATRSRHMHGEAMDIRLLGVSMKEVRDYLVEKRVGGVGFYHDNNFVHVDVGPFRTW